MKPHILLTIMLLSIPAAGAAPMAPAQLCVDNDCTAQSAASEAGSKKWRPGHYIKTQGPFYSTDQSSYIDGVLKAIPKASEIAQLRGAYVDIAWGAINPSGNTYNWKDLDTVLNSLCSRDKVLILSIGYKHFAGSADPQLIIPADLASEGHAATTGSGKIAAVWRAPVMNRLIDTMKAIAARYDSNPCLELITTSESAPSFGATAPPSDYSVDAMATQLRRLYAAQADAFEMTNVAAQLNYLGDEAANLMESAYQVGAGRAGPDAFDDAGTRIFRGEQTTGAGRTVRDYRRQVPHHAVASSPVLGGKDNNGPPSEIINWAQASEVTHLSWVTSVSTSPNTWPEIKAAIQADSSLSSACPMSYSGCSAP